MLLGVKTPLGWLLLSGIGLATVWGRRARLDYWLPVALALGVLVPAMTSRAGRCATAA